MAAQREIENVGVIGPGKMGLPMARYLAAQNFNVTGYPIRADLAAIAGEAGFAPATIPAALDKRVSFIDIPVTGAEKAADEGTLLVLGGGDKAIFDHCRPALDAVAREVLHLGDLGAGQVAKMVNNQILWACVSANYERMELAKSMGIDPEALRLALLKSSAQNWALQTRADERPLPWAEKDMMVVLQEADKVRISLPLAGTVKEVIKGIKIGRGLPMPTADD
mgnify:CR=1 FL=1